MAFKHPHANPVVRPNGGRMKVCPTKQPLESGLTKWGIHARVAKGDIEALRGYHLSGGDLNCTDSKGKTLLMIAAERGFGHIAGFLLENNVDVAVPDGSKTTALHYAISSGNFDIAETLLPLSYVNAQTMFGWTPLMLAAVRGDAQFLETLTMASANPELKDVGGRNALMKAVRNNHPEAVAFLAPRTKIDSVDIDGDTALIKAARYGFTVIVRTLLEFGADPAIREHVKGEDALEKALKHGFPETAALIREALTNKAAASRESQ